MAAEPAPAPAPAPAADAMTDVERRIMAMPSDAPDPPPTQNLMPVPPPPTFMSAAKPPSLMKRAQAAVNTAGEFGLGAAQGVMEMGAHIVDAPFQAAAGVYNAVRPPPTTAPGPAMAGRKPAAQAAMPALPNTRLAALGDAAQSAAMLAAPFFPPAALAMGGIGTIQGIDALRRAETPHDAGHAGVDLAGAMLMGAHGAKGLPRPTGFAGEMMPEYGPELPPPEPPPDMSAGAAQDAANAARWNQWGADQTAIDARVGEMKGETARVRDLSSEYEEPLRIRPKKPTEFKPVEDQAVVDAAVEALSEASTKRGARLDKAAPPQPEPAAPYRPQADYDSYVDQTQGMGADLDAALRREGQVQDRSLFHKTSDLTEQLAQRADQDAIGRTMDLVPELNRAGGERAAADRKTFDTGMDVSRALHEKSGQTGRELIDELRTRADRDVLGKGEDLVREIEQRRLAEGRSEPPGFQPLKEQPPAYPGDEARAASGYGDVEPPPDRSAAPPPPAPEPPPVAGTETVYTEPAVQAGRTAPADGFKLVRGVKSDVTLKKVSLDGYVDALGSKAGKPQFDSSIYNKTGIVKRRAESQRVTNELERHFHEKSGLSAADEARVRDIVAKAPETFDLFDRWRADQEFTPAQEKVYKNNQAVFDRAFDAYDRYLSEVDAADINGIDKGSLGPTYVPKMADTLGQQLALHGDAALKTGPAQARVRAGERASPSLENSRTGADIAPTNFVERVRRYRKQVNTELTTNPEIADLHKLRDEYIAAGENTMADNINTWISRNIKGEIGTLDKAISEARTKKLIDPASVKVGASFTTEGKIDPSVKGSVKVVSQRAGGDSPWYRIAADGKLMPGEYRANDLLAMKYENTVIDPRPVSKFVGYTNAVSAGLTVLLNYRSAMKAGADNVGRLLAQNSASDLAHGVGKMRDYLTGKIDKATRDRWADSDFLKQDLEQITQYAGDRGTKSGGFTIAEAVMVPSQVPDFIAKPIAYEATYRRLARENPTWSDSQLKTETAVKAAQMVDLKNSYTTALAEGTIGGSFFSFLKNSSARKWQQAYALVEKKDFWALGKMMGVPPLILTAAYTAAGGGAKETLEAISDMPFLDVTWGGKMPITDDFDMPYPNDAKVGLASQPDILKREVSDVWSLGKRLASGEPTTAKDWLHPLGAGPTQIGAALTGKPEALLLSGKERQPVVDGDKETERRRKQAAYQRRKSDQRRKR